MKGGSKTKSPAPPKKQFGSKTEYAPPVKKNVPLTGGRKK